MKKVFFLMLFFVVLGAASVSAQVRIGGDGEPNEAAILDLNEDDTNTGTKGLALPRVSLTDATIALPGTPTVDGMLVYNTNTSTSNGLSGIGIYYWDNTKWVGLMGTRLWTTTRQCTEAGALAAGGSRTIPFSTFGAPASASIETCFCTVSAAVSAYGARVTAGGVLVSKETASSVSPYVNLYCLIH